MVRENVWKTVFWSTIITLIIILIRKEKYLDLLKYLLIFLKTSDFVNFCLFVQLLAPNKTPNGLTCKSCHSFYDEHCDSDISCVGNQDRCFNDTGELDESISEYIKQIQLKKGCFEEKKNFYNI